jgi:7-carboxy-7-deazaguanine synthase
MLLERAKSFQKVAANRAKANHRHFLFSPERYTIGVSDTLVINEIYLSLQGESTFAGLPCIFIRLTACDLRCSYCDTAYAFTEGKNQSLAEICAEVQKLAAPFFGRFLSLTSGFSRVGKPEQFEAVSTASSMQKTAEAVKTHDVSPSTGLKPGANETMRFPLVELTGGEPLLQKNSLPLMKRLCDGGFTVLLETSGAHDISPVDPRVRRIMDLKCPGSGEAGRNCWENLKHLKVTDEIKFVIGTVEDYEWARQKIAEHRLDALCPLLFSWVHPLAPEQQNKSLKPVPAGQTPVSQRELAEKIIADALPVRFQVQMHKIIWPPEQRGV